MICVRVATGCPWPVPTGTLRASNFAPGKIVESNVHGCTNVARAQGCA
jgi:hypothetical protein